MSAGRIETLAERVLAGDRRALAQAITLVNRPAPTIATRPRR